MMTPARQTKISPTIFPATLIAALCLSLAQSARAVTLNYTNTTDAWLTSTSWSPANDWSTSGSGAVKTNTTTADVRLNIGTNANQAVSVTYTAALGTTIFDNTNVATRPFVIASGNNTTGAVTVAGGTLVLRNGTQADSLLVGTPASGGAAQGTLTLAGGNLVFTNANGSGFGVMCIPYRGGSTNGGPNFAQGTFTIGNNSTATIERTFFGFAAAEAGAQCTGTINLNAGGTLSTRNISARDGDTNQMTSFLNFNGGTLRVLGNNVADPTITFIRDVGSNLTVNVQASGAIIDTAGFNITIPKSLVNAGGGGLTKNGTGTLTLTNVNTYTGATVVNGGSLSLIYPMSSSALTLSNGTSATITANNLSWTNTAINLTNATLNLNLGGIAAVPSATTAVFKTAALKVSGTNTINLTASGFQVGNYKLIDYTSGANRTGSGTFVLGPLPAGIGATLVDGPNDVSLKVTYVSLVWLGAQDNNWVTNGLLNWTNALGVPVTYQETPGGYGDAVIFTDAAGSFYTVNLPSNVKPTNVAVNVTSAAVTLLGPGRITGTNGFTKDGPGVFNLANTNTYDGVTRIKNGTVQIYNDFALGSSVGGTVVESTGVLALGSGVRATSETVTLSGPGFGGTLGTLRGADNTDNIWASSIILADANARIGTEDSGKIIIAGPITDNGSNYTLTYRPGQNGTIIISNSAHAYGRTATFCGSGGIIKLAVANGFSSGPLYVGSGTIDLNGLNQTVGGVDIFSGNGVILNNGTSPSTLTINATGTNIFAASANFQDGSQPLNLVKLGTGRQTLTGTNHTYTGTTLVSEGELRVNRALGNTAVTVATNGVLRGQNGTIGGPITVNGGGTLAPGGDPISSLTNNNTLTLNAGSTNLFRVNAGSTNADLMVATAVNYGGQLVATNLSASPLIVGQVYKLFNTTAPSGNFANFTNVTIQPNGLGNFNPATGELTVTSLVVSNPTLNVARSGDNLQFTWTGTFVLQAQTNSLSVGLSNNWFNYPGGSTSPVNVPMATTNPTVFFRLATP